MTPALAIIAAAIVLGAATAPAQTADAGKGYEAFRLVRTRNIFDPNRQPGRTAESRPRQQTPATRSDYVALTGIMLTPEKSLAFFGGSRPDFNKVLPVRETIAGATITNISNTQIELNRDGKKFTVAVGQQFPLEGSAPIAAPAAPAEPAAGESPPEPAAPASAPAGDASDLMRRMMERRQKEISK